MAKNKKKTTKPFLDLADLKGIIIDRAVANYRMLPESAKRYTDLDDWISSGMVFAASDLSKRMERTYDSSKGAAIKTFIYRAMDNYYKNSLAFNTNKKRGGMVVSWEDLVGAGTVGQEDHKASAFVDKIDAIRKVQEMHRRASTDLVLYLDAHFFTQDHPGRIIVKGKHFEERRQEFRALASRLGVTIDDYRLAIRLYHEMKSGPSGTW